MIMMKYKIKEMVITYHVPNSINTSNINVCSSKCQRWHKYHPPDKPKPPGICLAREEEVMIDGGRNCIRWLSCWNVNLKCHPSFSTWGNIFRTSVTLTWAPPESVEGSPITRSDPKWFEFVFFAFYPLTFRFTVQQKTKDSESRTIGHTGGDLLTYRVDGLLPR